MSSEVKILASRLVGKSWPDFEGLVAQYLNEGWWVIGFSTERDRKSGDLVYVMLQRDTLDESETGIQPPGEGAASNDVMGER